MAIQALPTDGSTFRIRPIRPADEPAMVRFHATLSPETVYSRYFEVLGLDRRTEHDRLLRICRPEVGREVVLVAEEAFEGAWRIVAVGRLSKSDDGSEGEFALLVGDRWQGRGIGSELLRRLVGVARAEGVRQVWAEMLGANQSMRRTALAAGFTLTDDPASFTTRAELRLT
ncbi:MAG: GNAT family N-acetyltransferase [Chloroflexota bacterium]